MNWRPIEEYVNLGSNHRLDDEPLVLLWHRRAGYALGKVMKFDDGDVVTRGVGFHGFEFSHYSEITSPEADE